MEKKRRWWWINERVKREARLAAREIDAFNGGECDIFFFFSRVSPLDRKLSRLSRRSLHSEIAPRFDRCSDE